jgi:hypothetical protein
MLERDWVVETERLESREATKALVLALAGLMMISLIPHLVFVICIKWRGLGGFFFLTLWRAIAGFAGRNPRLTERVDSYDILCRRQTLKMRRISRGCGMKPSLCQYLRVARQCPTVASSGKTKASGPTSMARSLSGILKWTVAGIGFL